MANSLHAWHRIKSLLGVGTHRREVASVLQDSSTIWSGQESEVVPINKDPVIPSDASAVSLSALHNTSFESEALGPAAASRSSADNREQLNLIKSLCQQKRYAEAADLCERHFGEQKDARDEWGHPIYFKEMFRIALARCQYGTALEFAEKLEPFLSPDDPCIQLLWGRQHRNMNDETNARLAYMAALERSPDNPEAKTEVERMTQHSQRKG